MPSPRTVIFAVPHMALHDATANDIRMQKQSLELSGFSAVIFATSSDPGATHEIIGKDEVLPLLKDPNNLVIYHLCVFWDHIDWLLEQTQCPFVVRFHNITPERFFAPYDPVSAFATGQGLAQARKIFAHPKVRGVVANSPYTLNEVKPLLSPEVKQAAIAPFLDLSGLEHSSTSETSEPVLDRDKFHILFVGRFVPNKGHIHLIATLATYVEFYDRKVELHLVGRVGGNFRGYRDQVIGLAEQLGVADLVRIWDGITPRELGALYRESNAFLCLSEHEGFCVPVIEAQSLGLPVVALAQSAVADTVGPDQLSFLEMNYDQFAVALRKLKTDIGFKQKLVSTGELNAALYHLEQTARHLTEYVASFT